LLVWEFRGGLAGLGVWERPCWSGCMEEALLVWVVQKRPCWPGVIEALLAEQL